MSRSAATIEYRRRYAMQTLLTQVRAEFAARYPTPEQQRADEAKLWMYQRTEELRKERGL